MSGRRDRIESVMMLRMVADMIESGEIVPPELARDGTGAPIVGVIDRGKSFFRLDPRTGRKGK